MGLMHILSIITIIKMGAFISMIEIFQYGNLRRENSSQLSLLVGKVRVIGANT